MSETMQRNVVTARGMFVNLTAEIRRRKREYEAGERRSWKRGTCFIEMRCPVQGMVQEGREKTIPVVNPLTGEPVLWGPKTKNAGKPKMQGVLNPFLDFVNRDEETGKPKPKVLKVTRCRASIFYPYQEKVQAAQIRNGREADFEAGEPAWEWRRFEHDGIKMPFAYKVERDPETKAEIEQAVKNRKIYLCVLPEWVKRDENGVVRRDEKGEPIFYSENESWYEDIETGQKIDKKVLEPFLPVDNRESAAERQGHGNVDDLVQPLMPNILNVTYLAVMGKRYSFPQRDHGPLTPTDFEAIEWLVEDDAMTVDREETGYEEKSKITV